MFRRRKSTSVRPSGWAILIIALLVQLAAWNTGANELYLVAGGVFSFLLLATLLTGWTVRGLRVTREAPATVHRGDPFTVNVRIENRKRAVPALSLTVRGTPNTQDAPGYIMHIPAHRAALVTLRAAIPKRGAHRLPPVEISSAFPFGMFVRRVRFPDDAEVVVYPRIHAVRPGVLERMEGIGDTPRLRQGEGEEFFSLREYVPGDDLRRIAWRVSARVGFLVVRELEPSTSHNVYIAFDTRGLAHLDDFEERFEEAVELVASLAVSFINRQYAVAVVAPNAEIELGEGNSHARAILQMLARIEPAFYHEHTEDWFSPYEHYRAAGYVYVSPDPERWGMQRGRKGSRILDPREVVRA